MRCFMKTPGVDARRGARRRPRRGRARGPARRRTRAKRGSVPRLPARGKPPAAGGRRASLTARAASSVVAAMMPRRGWVCALGFVLALVAGCDRKAPAGAARDGSAARPQIAVVPKGTTHEFWKSVHAGSVKAARELGADVIWKGPVREDDRDEQIKVLEAFLSRGVAGIVVAPLDDRALVPVLKDASARAIPVVIIDSGIQWDGQVSFVATDNERAGALAAERL